jgi:L-threonylcarbamoyladenylate synthase
MQQVEQLGAILRQDVRKTLQSIWPAPLTAIVPIAAPVAASAGALSLAVRIPAAPWLRRLLSLTGPLASTSANKSGESPLTSVAKLPSELEREVDGIVDGGVLAGVASTIVDFTKSPPAVTREGAFRFTQNLWKTSRKSL